MTKASRLNTTARDNLAPGKEPSVAGGKVEHTSSALAFIEDRVNRMNDGACALALLARAAADLLVQDHSIEAMALLWCSNSITDAVDELANDIRAFKRDQTWQEVHPVPTADAAGDTL